MDLREQVLHALGKHSMSQFEFSKRARVSQGTISNLLRTNRKPWAKSVAKIKLALKSLDGDVLTNDKALGSALAELVKIRELADNAIKRINVLIDREDR